MKTGPKRLLMTITLSIVGIATFTIAGVLPTGVATKAKIIWSNEDLSPKCRFLSKRVIGHDKTPNQVAGSLEVTQGKVGA